MGFNSGLKGLSRASVFPISSVGIVT